MPSDLHELDYIFAGLPERDAKPFRNAAPALSTGELASVVATVAKIEDQYILVATPEGDLVKLYNGLYPKLRLDDRLMVYPDGSDGWSLSCPAWRIQDPGGEEPWRTCGSELRFKPTDFDAEGDRLLGTVNGIPAELARRDLVGLPRIPVYPLESLVGRNLKVRIYDPRPRPIRVSTYLADSQSFAKCYAKSDWGHRLLGKKPFQAHAGCFLLALLELVEHRPELPAKVVGVDAETPAGDLEVELYGVRLPVPSHYLSWRRESHLKPPWSAGDAITVEVEIDLAADSLLPRIVSSSDREWRRIQKLFPVGCRLDGSGVVLGKSSSNTRGLRRRGLDVEVRGRELCTPGLMVYGELSRGNDPYHRPPDDTAQRWLASGELEVLGHDEAGPRLLLSRARCLPAQGRRYTPGELVPVRTEAAHGFLLAYWELGHAACLPIEVGQRLRQFSWLRVAAVAGRRVLFNQVVNRRQGRVFETEAGELGVEIDDGTQGLLSDQSHAVAGEEVEVGLVDVVFGGRLPRQVFELCRIRKGARMQARVLSAEKHRLIVDLYGEMATLHFADVSPPFPSKPDRLVGKYLEVMVTRDDDQIEVAQAFEEEVERRLAAPYLKITEGSRLQGVVKKIAGYGVFVNLGGINGIDGLLHKTDISWGRVDHPSKHFSVGDEIEVVVLKFDPVRKRASLGYKQRTEDPWTLVDKKYPIGSRIDGRVVRLVDYGAFVEIEEGVEGLIHRNEMSWTQKVVDPSKILSVGDQIEAIVSELDMAKRRLRLSLRQTARNPWAELADSSPVGSVIDGKVRDLNELEAVVKLTEDIDGVIHVSDMGWTTPVKHPAEMFEKGDMVKAKIIDIDVSKQHVSLSIKEYLWDGFSTQYTVGDWLEARIVDVAAHGLFINYYQGLDGFVHTSKIDLQDQKPADKHRVGDLVRVRILRINKDKHRVLLTMLDEPRPDETAFSASEEADRPVESGSITDTTAAVTGPGTAGKELQAAKPSSQSTGHLPSGQPEAKAPVVTKTVRGAQLTFVPGKTSCWTFSSRLEIKKKQIESLLKRASLGNIKFRDPLSHEEFEVVTELLGWIDGKMPYSALWQLSVPDATCEDLVAQNQVGDMVVGIVTDIADLGLSLELPEGLKAFADVSDIELALGSVEDNTYDWAGFGDHYHVGDYVRARILRIEEASKLAAVTLCHVSQPSDEELPELTERYWKGKARYFWAIVRDLKKTGLALRTPY